MPINACIHPEKPSKTQNMKKNKIKKNYLKYVMATRECRSVRKVEQRKAKLREFRRSNNIENDKRHRSILYLVYKIKRDGVW